MVKHTQTISRQFADEFFFSVFDHFVGLDLKGLMKWFLNVEMCHNVLMYAFMEACVYFKD